jgi:hypothetical protein
MAMLTGERVRALSCRTSCAGSGSEVAQTAAGYRVVLSPCPACDRTVPVAGDRLVPHPAPSDVPVLLRDAAEALSAWADAFAAHALEPDDPIGLLGVKVARLAADVRFEAEVRAS